MSEFGKAHEFLEEMYEIECEWVMRWKIGDNPQYLSAAELIEFARSKGWIGEG